jgi:hypothetical protein
MYSEDSLFWLPAAKLDSFSLPANLREGYFINSAGEVVVFTRHLSFFGLKLDQPELSIESRFESVVESSHFVVNVRGGAGLGLPSVRSLTPSICQPVDVRRVETFDDCLCKLVAERLGDGIYLPETSKVFSFEVSKRFIATRSVGEKKLISFSLGEKYANQEVRLQIKRAGSNRFVTARTLKLTRTGVGWRVLNELKPGDAVRLMNPGVIYLTNFQD